MTSVTVRGVWRDEVPEGNLDARLLDGFTGAIGQSRVEQAAGDVIAVTGLGDRERATAAGLRLSASAAARRIAAALPQHPEAAVSVALTVDAESFASTVDPDAALAAVADGLLAGGYRFRMTGARTFVSDAVPVASGELSGVPGWRRGSALGAAVNTARDLVNLPAAALTPADFARWAKESLEPHGVGVAVRDAEELVANGYGGIIAVGQGADNPPRLLELTVGDASPEYAFVGKGVTFDTGGLSLKSSDALMDMKSDMAGAAAVVAAFALLPALAPGRSFAAVVPLVENMPGPGATRPGDVVTLRDGSTLEILNTDFEGRIILADALARAAELHPRAIVDIASLTYASRHALGDEYAALVSNDDALAAEVVAAGDRSGDRAWRMPLQPELEYQIRSDLADYKNFPGVPHARVSTAALLLSRFVGDIPWAHLDITGPCYRHASDAFGAAGGTGYGVRLLAELVRGA
ncbi:leucyl aminopeptidase family protein [Microbacterium sp. dk485]|uniref:leucyl aminopeptidase family protein n=1 Tax=Microbacterium sp. dk485 TaxID=2560021 RepID=UPI0010746CD4|nr:leucyl aminopeptidase family protein [Microbacterium sp. dk485]TFV80927.1 leucyl aminopeptidase family protein [Microbacterium sp. dk485]